MPKHFMIAAAGVSLSKHTMHRTHDPRVETFDERCTRWILRSPRLTLWSAFGRPARRREPGLYGHPRRPSTGNLRFR